jgi:tetratricopeptide (TPR) repeat protein
MALAVTSVLVLNIADKMVFAEDKNATEQPRPNQARMQLLNNLKNQGDSVSIRQAQDYLGANPNDADVLSFLSEAYINKNDLVAGEEAIKKAIAIKPNDPYAIKILARVYTLKAATDPANFALALEQIDKALVANPDDEALLNDKVKVCVAEAKVYTAQNNIEKANAAIDKAINLSTGSEKSDLMSMKEAINKPAPAKPNVEE